LHYLLKAGELLAIQAITLHNVNFMNRMMKAIRQAIQSGTLEQEAKNWLG
jgi:queuine tRNA-ribosyltransferase